jgi:hypothetical protein
MHIYYVLWEIYLSKAKNNLVWILN